MFWKIGWIWGVITNSPDMRILYYFSVFIKKLLQISTLKQKVMSSNALSFTKSSEITFYLELGQPSGHMCLLVICQLPVRGSGPLLPSPLAMNRWRARQVCQAWPV